MKVLFLADNRLERASYRYRVHQYLPALKASGIRYDVVHPKDIRLMQIHRLRGYDVVFIQKALYSVHWLMLASLAAPRIVFDLDDAIWTSVNHNWGAFVQRRVRNRLACVSRKSSLVIAGNNYLAEHVRRYGAKAVVIPTCLDTDHYRPAERLSSNGEVRIGWIGRGHNLVYMRMLETAFARLSGEVDARLVIISNERYESANIPTECIEWSLKDELEALWSLDIGIMPLVDDDWTRGKCSFKLLQYMACGIPTISSPVGMNADVVRDGENGFLADSSDEWFDKLNLLINDQSRRLAVASAGRRTAEDRFSNKLGARMLIQALEDVVAQAT